MRDSWFNFVTNSRSMTFDTLDFMVVHLASFLGGPDTRVKVNSRSDKVHMFLNFFWHAVRIAHNVGLSRHVMHVFIVLRL